MFDREEKVIARGRIDWIFLEQDPATQRVRPVAPDQELVDAFPIIDDRAIADELSSVVPDRPPSVEMTRMVRPTEIDRYQHVNHTEYVRWIDDLGLPVRHVHLRFEKGARSGDQVTLRAWYEEGRGVVEIRRGDARISVAGVL